MERGRTIPMTSFMKERNKFKNIFSTEIIKLENNVQNN
jgi:hypothetical protein